MILIHTNTFIERSVTVNEDQSSRPGYRLIKFQLVIRVDEKASYVRDGQEFPSCQFDWIPNYE